MREERRDAEEEEGLEEGVGTDLAQAEFALGGDDEEGDAEVAEGVAVEEKGCEGLWRWSFRGVRGVG